MSKNNFYTLEFTEQLQEVFECLYQSKYADLRFFVSFLLEYDMNGEFLSVQKTRNSSYYELTVKGKKICGGDIGIIDIRESEICSRVLIQDKSNKDNFYELRYNFKEKEGKLLMESVRYLKTISFNIRKKLFGQKVENVKSKTEKLYEPGCY